MSGEPFPWPDPFGFVAFCVLLAIPVALILSVIFNHLYRRSVRKGMMQIDEVSKVPPPVPVPEPAAGPPPPLGLQVLETNDVSGQPANEAFRRAQNEPRHLALIYLLAAAAHAAVSVFVLFFSKEIEFLPRRTLIVFLVLIWPAIPTIALTGITTLRTFWLMVAGYLVVLLAISGSYLINSLQTLGMLAVIPTLLALFVANPKFKTAGPFALLAAFAASTGAVGGFFLAGWAMWVSGLPSMAGLGVAQFLGLSLGAIAWPVMGFAAQRFRRKKTSSQALVLDIWWLLYTIWLCYFFSLDLELGGLLGLLAFVAYKVVLWIAFAGARAKNRDRENLPLLLLRVFGFDERSQRLMTNLNRHWRHLGTIRLIGSQDLAVLNMNLDRFLLFLNRQLGRVFLRSGDELEVRLAGMDTEPDPDGRFRVNELFCQSDAWQRTVRRIAKSSGAVLMDLRGFSRNNQGCVWEIEQLVELVPSRQILFLADDSTDLDLLRSCLAESWSHMTANSPNRNHPAPLRVLRLQDDSVRETRALLQLLCQSAVARG